jgi:DNA-binding NarL/FixJ family response regulator
MAALAKALLGSKKRSDVQQCIDLANVSPVSLSHTAAASRSTSVGAIAAWSIVLAKPLILVGDEQRIFTEAFVHILGVEYDIVSAPEGVQRLLDDVVRLRPNLIIKGLTTDKQRGLALLRAIHQAAPDARILIITAWDDAAIAAEAFRCGASAYVLQTCPPEELLDAVRAALAHGSYVTPRLAAPAIESLLSDNPDDDFRRRLTERQHAVIRLLAEGKSMKEVAAALDMKTSTVAFHKYRIMRALNIKSSAELVRFAVMNGIV